jgi:membrane-associated phospholipid phosphatase
MKVAWVSYFFLPVVVGIVLYAKGNRKGFGEAKILLVLAWLLSFGFYYAMPAKGPLYFKHELGLTDPGDGVAIAGALKQVVSNLEGGEARDTFPSGHAMIAALVILVCLRQRLWKTAIAVIPLALAVIVSTMVLRYHYVIDVVVGLALCIPMAWLGVLWNGRRHQASSIKR